MVLPALQACRSGFDADFTGEGLRIDYYAAGDRGGERAEFVCAARTPLWSGPRTGLVPGGDDAVLPGDYRIVMLDAESGDTLYVNGFNTLFGEWRTTAQALQEEQKYYSSNTVPMPRRKCTVNIECRDRHTMLFGPTGSFAIDPAAVPECGLPANEVQEVQICGEPSRKVDLTFLAEGYTAAEREKFASDVRRFTEALFGCPPFSSRREDFNVRAVYLESKESGAGGLVTKDTALGANYWTFGTDRYLTISDMKPVADAVWDVPTDAVFVLVNEEVYGGGGIYNFYATGSSDNPRTLSVFLHEFGHSFGALADEYFDSETGYDQDAFYVLSQEPWEPNITTLKREKWQSWHNGLHEGGGYREKGIWRPEDHCMMRDYAPFCPVCSKAIEERIDYYTSSL